VDDEPPFSERWRRWRQHIDLDEYQSRWDRLEAAGKTVHGEADFVDRYATRRVLDAGCGMGRVALELAKRGYEVVGVDNDRQMLARAEARESSAEWQLGDLTTVEFAGTFDTIVLAGDVMLYVEPSRRHLVVPNLVRALEPGGCLICGSSFAPPFTLVGYDDWCHFAGLELTERYGSWERDPYRDEVNYAVSVHRAAEPEAGADPSGQPV